MELELQPLWAGGFPSVSGENPAPGTAGITDLGTALRRVSTSAVSRHASHQPCAKVYRARRRAPYTAGAMGSAAMARRVPGMRP